MCLRNKFLIAFLFFVVVCAMVLRMYSISRNKEFALNVFFDECGILYPANFQYDAKLIDYKGFRYAVARFYLTDETWNIMRESILKIAGNDISQYNLNQYINNRNMEILNLSGDHICHSFDLESIELFFYIQNLDKNVKSITLLVDFRRHITYLEQKLSEY